MNPSNGPNSLCRFIPRKTEKTTFVRVFTTLYDDDGDLIADILATDGENASKRVRNWMREAYALKKSKTKKVD